jgi:hypothetical protein
MISIDTLVKEGSIHPFQATQEEIARVMDIARRALAEAEKIQGSILDRAFKGEL